MATKEEIFANRIFLNSVLPLLKVIVENQGTLAQKFKNRTVVVQISADDPDGKVGTYFNIQNGAWNVVKGIAEKADLELEFQSIPHLNGFFAGKSKKFPRIKGWYKISLLSGVLKALMYMAKMLGATKPPVKETEKDLLVKLFFYLLPSGISQLNKAGHPEISKWAGKSPDRVYAWVVNGKPELSSYIRVKAGKTKAAHGQYTYSKPFFTMRFDSVDSALGILLQRDDMIAATTNGRIIMEGAPEFGAQIGEFMMLVGSYAK
jgi:hypothetical protein